MKHPSTSSRILAGIAGTGCVTGSLMILLGDQLWHPAAWHDHHWLTILMVGGTIAVGKLTHKAWPSRKLSSFGFAVMFLVGTLLTVYNSVGRQAETTDAKQLTAEQTNTAIASKSADLSDARNRLIRASDKVELYTNGGVDPDTGKTIKAKCGEVCNDWKERRSDAIASVEKIEAQLAALGPKKPVNAKAEKFAEIAALFSFDKAKATAAFALLEPFLFTLFFEFGSIIALGFAFTGSVAPVRTEQSVVPDFQQPLLIVSDEPNPDRPGDSPVRTEKQKALSDLIGMLADGRTIPSQEYLTDHWNRPKQTVSDWMCEWRRIGVIPSETRSGRCKATVPA